MGMINRLILFVMIFVLYICFMPVVAIEDEAGETIEFYENKKNEQTVKYYLPDKMVVSGDAKLTLSAELIKDDMYGVQSSIFSSNGMVIAVIYIDKNGIYLDTGMPGIGQTIYLGNNMRGANIIEMNFDLTNKTYSAGIIGGRLNTGIPFKSQKAEDVSGIFFSAGGTKGEGIRHVLFKNIKLSANSDGETSANITEPPNMQSTKVLPTLLHEKFVGNVGTKIIGDTYYGAGDGRTYAEMKNESGDPTTGAYKISFPKQFSNGLYTISFDYCYMPDSIYGLQLSLVSGGGTQAAVLNISADKIVADQEEFKPSARLAQVSSTLKKGQWYNVKIVISPETQSFDVYIDGEKTGQGITFRKKAALDIGSIYMTPGGGMDNKGLRHILVSNLLVQEGANVSVSKPISTIEATEATTKYVPFPKEEYLIRLDDAWCFKEGNPYMLYKNERAIYDWKTPKTVAIKADSPNDLLVPKGVIDQIAKQEFNAIEKDGRQYVSLKDVATSTGKILTVYDDGLYIIASKTNPFTATKEADMIAQVKERFPTVSAIVKPENYPFKVLFNNDLTNIFTCKWDAKTNLVPNDRLIQQLINLTVDETASTGIDVHTLAPGLSSTPLWKSRTVPMEENAAWWKERYGTDMGVYSTYILKGGDIVDDFITRCRENNLMSFISIRMNDAHHTENIFKEKGQVAQWYSDFLSKFYYDHSDKIVGDNTATDWSKKVLDWKVDEVREYKFNIIRDLCENYDIDGIELDFLRHFSYFIVEQTTTAERATIITNFVKDIRTMLDSTSINGKYRYLSIRIPSEFGMNDYLGIDVAMLANAGVDIFNVSPSYYTSTQLDIAPVKTRAGDKFVAAEITHANLLGYRLTESQYDSYVFSRTTPNQIYTAAHYAYNRGADGLSAFNFAYYREYGAPGTGPFNEPPFEVFKYARDKEFVDKQAHQYYATTSTFGTMYGNVSNFVINRVSAINKRLGFNLDVAIPKGGYLSDGKLRLRFDKDAQDSNWLVRFNGEELVETKDTKELYENSYSQFQGVPEDYRCFIVPKDLILEGQNFIDATMLSGTPRKLIWLDLCIK